MAERNEKGQFVKGKTGNPKGRATRARETKYLDILMTACTFEDWKAILNKAVYQAKRGDPVARKWLADYLVGKPEDTINLNGDLTFEISLKWAEDE